ncbi:uncharacterized protein LOC110449395 [Mizuhopecten yessoensis]|uniref:uncharacterized protein LOC110449395 n=1 Tax=Mizuhopecten yessoensis TaxID=6573 RepID=UPI000B45F50D|nr:uncharacterized protein LOC110449395 [Mizuhopecten yessoensis]
MSSIVLMIWINDDPIQGNILKISTIVEPRIAFGEYREGQRVRVKCPGFGIQSGVIGKIGDDSKRKEFQELLAGPGFKKLVETVCGGKPMEKESGPYLVEDIDAIASKSDDGLTTGTAAPIRIPRIKKKRSLRDMHQDGSENEAYSNNGSEHGEITSDDDLQLINRPLKKKTKTQTTNQDIEALKVKKDVAKTKRDAQKAREKVGQMVSSVLVDGDGHVDTPSVSEKLIAIVNNTNTILAMVHQLFEKQADIERQLAEITSCKQCVKAMYKVTSPCR